MSTCLHVYMHVYMHFRMLHAFSFEQCIRPQMCGSLPHVLSQFGMKLLNTVQYIVCEDAVSRLCQHEHCDVYQGQGSACLAESRNARHLRDN